MSNNNMYDELASLFGLATDDKRPRLFLHAFLKTVPSRNWNRIFQHSNNWDRKTGVIDGDWEPEMIVFTHELAQAISDKTETNDSKKRDLAILNKYKAVPNIDTVAALVGASRSTSGKNSDFVKISNTSSDFSGLSVLINQDYRSAASMSPKNKTLFSYKIDKATAQGMLEEAKNEPGVVGATSSFLASLDGPSGSNDVYFRDPKDCTKLYTKADDGSLVEVQRGSAKFWEESKDNCAGFHVSKGNPVKCTDYLLDCINGSDPKACRDYMTDKGFWGSDENSIKSEVKSMLPAMALTTLEKFGFKQLVVADSVAKKSINKVESVTAWLQRLEKEMDAAEFGKIQANTNLTLYLNLLVEKINGSPAILNENCTASEGTLGYNPAKFEGQLLAQYGLKPKLPTTNIVSSVARLSDTLRYGLAVATEAPRVIVALKGGALPAEEYKFTSIELENQFNLLKNMLKAHGKELDTSNDNELKALFANFKTTENKVVQTMKIMKKYIELMDAFAYNDPHKVLNLETLNEITKAHEHQLNKTSKKQEGLVQALQTLADAVQEAVNRSKPATASATASVSTPFSHKN